MRALKCLLIIMVIAVLALPAAQTNLKVRVKVQKANVRSTPDMAGPVVRKVSAGMVFDVIKKSGPWYNVQLPADGVNPAQKGFINENVVSELAGKISPPAALQKQPKKPAKPVRAEIEKFKRFTLRGSYFMGFTSETLDSTYAPTIYHEQASFVASYEAKKGNSIDAALGYRLSPVLGVEVGAAIASRDVAVAITASVPHPLIFNAPRQVTGSQGYELKETGLYLNLVYSLKMKSIGIDLFAGPCYVMAETTLVSEYQVSDAYPYTEVNVSFGSKVVKKNAIGFNAGIAAGYDFGDSLGLVLSARYIVAKAKFDTATDVPGIDCSVGGLQAGVGLRLKF